jgi:hypothetical protein
VGVDGEATPPRCRNRQNRAAAARATARHKSERSIRAGELAANRASRATELLGQVADGEAMPDGQEDEPLSRRKQADPQQQLRRERLTRHGSPVTTGLACEGEKVWRVARRLGRGDPFVICGAGGSLGALSTG